jgi:hypothetical protein
MNPLQAQSADYMMYYHDTYMYFDGSFPVEEPRPAGVYNVRASDGRCSIVVGRDAVDVPARTLSIWWPETGCYNIRGEGYYIGRVARRSMKKSAYVGEPYYIIDGNGLRQDALLKGMAEGRNLMPMAEAIELLKKDMRQSVAVRRHLLLRRRDEDSITASYKGITVGLYYILSKEYEQLYSDKIIHDRVVRIFEQENITWR